MLIPPFPNHTSLIALSVALLILLAGCAERADQAQQEMDAAANVVEITVTGLQFEAPAEIPSGWSTFRLNNAPEMTHFALIERMPEGVGIAEQQEEVGPIFQQGMDLLKAGQVDSAMARFGELPEWYHEVVFLGGPGLTGPGKTAETTLYLGPGTYLLECYVKTNGIFHSYNPSPSMYGMVHEFTVTQDSTAMPKPEAMMDIRISGDSGIVVEGQPALGENIVAVHFVDQTVHENFVGHDVHLVRLEEDTDIDELDAWMDWSQPTGLETPAPAEFLGGTNEMPAGSTAYLTVNLEPGRYAWVSEVTNPVAKGMFEEFRVGE